MSGPLFASSFAYFKHSFPALTLPTSKAIAASAAKLHKYGDVSPHVVLPFVVEHAGALGKDAMGNFRRCRTLVKNRLSHQQDAISTWSSRGFSNYFLQALSVANLKGLGHFFMVAANAIRAG